jgi:Fe-S-cluster-containing hydrogenase component 2
MPKSLKIIPDKCTGCMQCELACSWVQTGTFQPAASLIKVHVFDEEAAYTPYTCFQCNEAWCMTSCPVNAITINPGTDAKLVVEETCVGCGLCTISCPFGTMYMNQGGQKATKCDLCSGDPACARACPTGAIEFEEVGDTAEWLQPLADSITKSHEFAFAGE